MSAENPPYPYYDGIPYNSEFFTTETSSGLSETKANSLYLRKTTTDTATALETFNGGISTSTLKHQARLYLIYYNYVFIFSFIIII